MVAANVPAPAAVFSALGLPDPTSAERVHGGADAIIWRVEFGGSTYALRLLRPDQVGQARRESTALAAAAAAGIPVPRIVVEGSWRSHPALVLTWSPGRPLGDVLLHEHPSDLERARALGVAFGRVQGAIHAAPLPDALRAHPVPWEAWAGPDPALQASLAALPAQPPVLLHLDYHPLNILVEGDRVTGVLDWANARSGDPRADVARTLSILHLAPLPTGAGASARNLRRSFAAGWRRGYEETAGPLRGLAPFCWWAGLVMERDLSPRLGRSELPWLTPAFLVRVRRWTAGWRARAQGRA